jgi:hypothetical protein
MGNATLLELRLIHSFGSGLALTHLVRNFVFAIRQERLRLGVWTKQAGARDGWRNGMTTLLNLLCRPYSVSSSKIERFESLWKY